MYFCKNCGQQYVTEDAIMCVKCGAAKGTGLNYCQGCGSQVPPNAFACPNCGVGLAMPQNAAANPNAKSKVAAGLLGIFLGAFGVHNFYLGYTGKAVAQLLITVLSCGILSWGSAIWGLVEGIMILTGSINTDAKGNFLKD